MGLHQLLALLPLLPLAFSAAVSEGDYGLISAETDAYITSLVERWNSTGLSVVVTRQGEAEGEWMTEFRTYGVANELEDAPTPDTIFSIASNSKLFTALSVGLLISNDTTGKLQWNSKAKDVYGDLWELWDEEATSGVKIQDMFSHRTGLPSHDLSGRKQENGVRDVIDTLRYLRPSASFREQFQYNNLMYETLSYLPTLLLNQSLPDFVQSNFFDRLNMSSATYSVEKAESSGNLAQGFVYDMSDIALGLPGQKKPTIPFLLDQEGQEIWQGAAGVLSSARDLATWLQMLMNNGRHPITNETIVPADVIDRVATGVSVSEGKEEFPEFSPRVYGAAHWRYSYQGHDVIDHTGHNYGWHSQVGRYPNDNLGIIVLSNDESDYFIIEVARWKIVDQILGLNSVDWETRYLNGNQASYALAAQQITPAPASPSAPSSSFADLEGSFTHGTYGTLDLCHVPKNNESASSDYCTDLIRQPVFARALEATSNSTLGGNTEALVTLLPDGLFASHIVLRQFDGDLFNASFIWSNYNMRVNTTYESDDPEGYVITNIGSRVQAEWVAEEEGWAFKGGLWGASGQAVLGIDGELVGAQGKDSAEVWFARA